jgi:hypothetical protein
LSSNFSLIGFVVRELQVLEVEEVEMVVLFSSIKASSFSFGLNFGQRHKIK